MSIIQSVEELEALYGAPSKNSLIKEIATINDAYAAFINASPFCLLATVGPEGLDCSPRGEAPGFVRILDEKTLAMPDRKGNNRLDSLKNLVRDPRYSLCFLIPGSGTCIRVTGTAKISADEDLLQQFTMENKPPKSVVLFDVETIYFQCGKSIIRSGLWDLDTQVDVGKLPTQGQLIKAATNGDADADEIDKSWNERWPKTLW